MLYPARRIKPLSSLGGRLIYVSNRRLRALAAGDSSHWESVVAVLCADALQVGIPLVATVFALIESVFRPTSRPTQGTIINTLVILATGYLACRQVSLAADKIIQSHRIRGGVDVRSRALYTEVSALRKAILFVLAFLTVATAMIFCAPLRHVGTSLLASAGLVTVLAGVVVQRSLGHLFAGFQLALTQPILLDDLVVVEGELGKVEEITPGLRRGPSLGSATSRCSHQLLPGEAIRKLDPPLPRTCWGQYFSTLIIICL